MRHPLARFVCGLFVTAALLNSVGCESAARYDVVAPAASRGAIPRNAGAIVSRDKIDYEVFQADDKVIVRFVNRTGHPLTLTEQSNMLDAGGRSFGVEVQTLAPDESGRIVLPPAFAVDRSRPTAVATEVRVGGVDEGGMIGSRRDVEINDASGGSTGAAAPQSGFRWPPNANARLRLMFNVEGTETPINHEWMIRRSR